MVKDKKVIIFDLDGTLIDSVGIWNEIDLELIKRIGKVPVENENIGRQRDKKLSEFSKFEDPYLEYCGFLGEKYKSALSKTKIKELRYEISNDYLINKIDYKANAEKFLDFMKEKGYTLVIASTTGGRNIGIYKTLNKNIMNKAPLDKYFSIIYTKDSIKEVKPSPEIHYKIMEELNVKKEECLIFEDSLVGVQAANNAGIECAIIYDKFNDGDREEINSRGQYFFKDFNELLCCVKTEFNDMSIIFD